MDGVPLRVLVVGDNFGEPGTATTNFANYVGGELYSRFDFQIGLRSPCYNSNVLSGHSVTLVVPKDTKLRKFPTELNEDHQKRIDSIHLVEVAAEQQPVDVLSNTDFDVVLDLSNHKNRTEQLMVAFKGTSLKVLCQISDCTAL